MKTSVKILAFALSLFLYTNINAQTDNPYPGTSPSTSPSLNDTTDKMNRPSPTRRDKTKMDDTTMYHKKGKKADTTMTKPDWREKSKKSSESDTLK